MTIRKKTTILITATVAAIMVLTYASARLILLDSYAKLEEEGTRRNVERVRDALLNEIAGLDQFVHDWAAWDDTYAFVEDHNEEYIRSNIPDQTFINLSLNLILVLDTSGRLVFGKFFDLERGEETPAPPGTMEHFSRDTPLLAHRNTESSINGIVLLPLGPLLVASRPILTSENGGPIRGSLIMGRYLTGDVIRHLSEMTHLPITVSPSDNPRAEGGASAAPGGSGITVRTSGSKSVAGRATLRDVYGNPALAVEVVLPREIYTRGKASIAFYALSILVAGAVICGVILILLDKLVLARLSRMSAMVRSVGAGGGLATRVDAGGRDELAGLAADINGMLETLERSQKELRERTGRVDRQKAAILELSMQDLSNRETALRKVARTASKALGAERVNIWALSDDHSEIICLVDYNGNKDEYTGGARRAVKDFPSYFKAVEESRLIVAEEARTDARTRERAEAYLIPHGVTSTIDAPVRLRGKTIGILCLEHAGAPREWTHDEQQFAGSLANIVSLVFEASGRARAEGARMLLAEAVEHSAEMIVISDSRARVQYANPAFERNTGYSCEEIRGKTLGFLKSGKHDEAFFREMWKTLRKGEVWKGRITNRRKDGSLYEEEVTISPILDAAGNIINFVEIKRDITQEASLEMQLRHAQKLEAIGTLAGGMGHDFNNILAGIMGYASLLKQGLGKPETRDDDLEAIERLSLRGAELTKALLTFSRRGEHHPKPLDITDIAEGVLKVIGSTAGKRITLRTEFSPGVPNVFGDEGQLNQVLMNLFINACEAMPLGGTLTVVAQRAETEKSFFALHPDLGVGPYVSVTVSDTGSGMDAGTCERIFEPFFSTKSSRSGTGLGLSIVQGIVKRHGGCIEVESEEGVGSAFTVYLPATEEEISAVAAKPDGSPGGDETILVVDDENEFRSSVCRWLAGLGYNVLEAASGEKALKIIGRGDGVDLVILDMEMKGLGGNETFRRLREASPSTAVLICSGYTFNGTVKGMVEMGAKDFIQKPFELADLAVKLRSALDMP